MLLHKCLSLGSLAIMSLSLVLIVFGQAIFFGAVSTVLSVSNTKINVLDIIFLLRYMPYLGLIPQGIGAGLLAYFLMRSEAKVDIPKVKKQFLRLFVIFAIGAILISSALVTIPVVHANLVASANYYLDSPLPLDGVYVGEYNNNSYFVINGANWHNFAQSSNRTLVESYALGNSTTGHVYAEVPFDYNLTIPPNVSVVENVNGLTRIFCNPINRQGNSYTVTIDKVNSGYYLVQDSTGRYMNGWQSSNSVNAINSAVNNCTNGGSVYVGTGRYSANITVQTGVKFVLDIGTTGVYSSPAQGATCLILNYNSGIFDYYTLGNLTGEINLSAGTTSLSPNWQSNWDILVNQIISQSTLSSLTVSGTGSFGNVTTIDPQQPYSYMVYVDPSNSSVYKAKAANGTVCWSSTDFSTTVQAVLSSCKTGTRNTVYITGYAVLTSQVNLTSNIKICGDAVIAASPNFKSNMFAFPLGTSNVEIAGLTLNGNWPTRPNGTQENIIIGLGLLSNIYIHDNIILNSPWVGIGFGFAENSSGTMQNIRIENNNITNTYSDAIFVSHTLQPIVSRNSLYNIGDSGVVFSNSTYGGIIDANMIQKVGVTVGGQGIVVCSAGTNDVSITGNNIDLSGVSGARGIEIGWGDEDSNYVSDVTISGNTVVNGTTFLLFVSKTQNLLVSGNHFINTTGNAIVEDISVIGNNSYLGNTIITCGNDRAVKLYGANDTFIGNTLVSTTGTESGITVFSSSDYNTISGNKISGYNNGIIVLIGAHTAIFSNDIRGCTIPIISDMPLPEHDNLADSGWLPET